MISKQKLSVFPWLTVCIACLLSAKIQCQMNQYAQNSSKMLVGESKMVLLNLENEFTQNITIYVHSDKIQEFKEKAEDNPHSPNKWYLFIDAEPSANVTWAELVLIIGTKNLMYGNYFERKRCTTKYTELEACFLTNEDFDYEKQSVQVTIEGKQEVSLELKSEISFKYELPLNVCLSIDFLTQASYTKILQIDLSKIKEEFAQIRVTLTPQNGFYTGHPVEMYAATQQYIPSPQNYDMKSVNAWGSSKLLRFTQTDLIQSQEIILFMDLAENFVYYLDTEIILNHEDEVRLKSQQLYNDYLSIDDSRTFIVTISDPEVDSYLKIRQYSGKVQIDSMDVLEWTHGSQNSEMQELQVQALKNIEASSYDDEHHYKIFKNIKRMRIVLKVLEEIFFNSTYCVYSIQVYQNQNQYNELFQGAQRVNELIRDEKAYFVVRVLRHSEDGLGDSKAIMFIRNLQGATVERLFDCKQDSFDKCVDAVKEATSDPSKELSSDIEEIESDKSIEDLLLAEKKQLQIDMNESGFMPFGNPSEFQSSKSPLKQKILVLSVEGLKTSPINEFSVEYRNVGLMTVLSETRFTTDRANKGQLRYYQFTTPDVDLMTSIVFHSQVYDGALSIRSIVSNPAGKTLAEIMEENLNQDSNVAYRGSGNIEILDPKPLKTYYIEVYAQKASIYSIRTQIIRKSDPERLDLRDIDFSILNLQDGAELKYRLLPNEMVVFDYTATKGPQLLIEVSSELPVEGCFRYSTSDYMLPPIRPNCQYSPIFGKDYTQVLSSTAYLPYFGIHNPYSKMISISAKFSTIAKCQRVLIGQRTVLRGYQLGSTSEKDQYCGIFKIYRPGALFVNFKSLSPLKQHSLKATLQIGKSVVKPLTASEIQFSSQELQEDFQQNFENCYGKVNWELNNEQASFEQIQNQKFIFEVQYSDSPIDLIDGTSHTSFGKVSTSQPRHFKYLVSDVQGMRNSLRLILQNQKGYYRALVKLCRPKQRHLYPVQEQYEQNGQKQPQQSLYDMIRLMQTSNQMFYLYETLEIPVESIQAVCESDSTCQILITVLPQRDEEDITSDGKFSIQIVEHTTSLIQLQPSPGYLEYDMLQYYSIDNSVKGETLVIYTDVSSKRHSSSHLSQQSCLTIYAKHIDSFETVTPSNYDHKSVEGASELVINNAKQGTYSIALKGTSASQPYCDYHIQYSIVSGRNSQDSKLRSIKKGIALDVEMSPYGNKFQYFLYEHTSKTENIKVITMFSLLGEVVISAIPLTEKTQRSQILNDFDNIQNTHLFGSAWKDANSLQIATDNPIFCGECQYLIRLQCISAFAGKVIVSDSKTQISIKANSLIHDHLKPQEKSTYRIYTDSTIHSRLHVIIGEVRFRLINKQTQQTLFEKTYKTSDGEVRESIILENDQTYDYLRYEIFEVQATVESSFMFVVVKDDPSTKQQEQNEQIADNSHSSLNDDAERTIFNHSTTIVQGVPKNITLSESEPCCMTGTMGPKSSFLFSIAEARTLNQHNEAYFNDFSYSLSIHSGNSAVVYSSQQLEQAHTNSSLVVSIDLEKNTPFFSQKKESYQYTFCMSSAKSMNLVLTQSSVSTFFLKDIPYLVANEANFTMYAQKENILEVDQCMGQPFIEIQSNYKDIGNQLHEVKQIRKVNSLIEFNHPGVVYMRVGKDPTTKNKNNESSYFELTLKQVDFEMGRGLGYYMFEPNSFRILSHEEQTLELAILPLKEISYRHEISNSAQPQIKKIEYRVAIAKEALDLNGLMNCNSQQADGVQVTVSAVQNSGPKGYFEDQILELKVIDQVARKFKDYRYVLIGVKALVYMENCQGEQEQYRFFYPPQELFLQDIVEEEDDADYEDEFVLIFVAVFVVIAVVAVVAIVVCLKYKKCLQGLTNRRQHQMNEQVNAIGSEMDQIDSNGVSSKHDGFSIN